MEINRVLAVLSIVALVSCGQSSRETVDTTSTTMSPWHSLTATEISEAAAAANKALGEGIIFNRISLTEPDKTDARGIAQVLRSGWFNPVHVKSREAHALRALLSSRKAVQRKCIDLANEIRGLCLNMELHRGRQ